MTSYFPSTSPAVYQSLNITTGTTNAAIKTGPGALRRVIVNTLVASATITVYDSLTASGTKLATITLPSTITGVNPFYISFDCGFVTGLTVVTSGATDVTICYQ